MAFAKSTTVAVVHPPHINWPGMLRNGGPAWTGILDRHAPESRPGIDRNCGPASAGIRKHQFNRFDLIEALLTKASNDARPESYRVDHDSINVVERGNGLTDENKVRLWQPHIAASLTALHEEHKEKGRSLGIIRPDPDSLKFFWKDAEHEDQEDTRSVQASLLDESLRPLKPQEFTFF